MELIFGNFGGRQLSEFSECWIISVGGIKNSGIQKVEVHFGKVFPCEGEKVAT